MNMMGTNNRIFECTNINDEVKRIGVTCSSKLDTSWTVKRDKPQEKTNR